ncbi:hypothetical protein ACFL3V_00120 [Nanoarchaeota archaeon]
MAILQDIKLPSKEEICTMPYERFVATSKDNIEVLLEYHLSEEVPYFGLHGTPRRNLRSILEQKQGYLNIGTFYDKEKSRKRLFQLLAMCELVTRYSCKPGDSPGGVMVFDLERDGRNITDRWENLHVSLFGLASDYKGDQEIIKGINDNRDTLWRSDLRLNRNIFDKHFVGTVSFESEGQKYFSELDYPPMEGIGRNELKNRIKSQEILASVYDMLRS